MAAVDARKREQSGPSGGDDLATYPLIDAMIPWQRKHSSKLEDHTHRASARGP